MDITDMPELSATLAAVRALPRPADHHSMPVLRHGSLELRMMRPAKTDDQTPHDRDELYIVATGAAVLLRGVSHSPFDEEPLLADAEERIPVGPGDAVVVPAGTPHRFTEFGDDFSTWVVFWGPEGGEVP